MPVPYSHMTDLHISFTVLCMAAVEGCGLGVKGYGPKRADLYSHPMFTCPHFVIHTFISVPLQSLARHTMARTGMSLRARTLVVDTHSYACVENPVFLTPTRSSKSSQVAKLLRWPSLRCRDMRALTAASEGGGGSGDEEHTSLWDEEYEWSGKAGTSISSSLCVLNFDWISSKEEDVGIISDVLMELGALSVVVHACLCGNRPHALVTRFTLVQHDHLSWLP